jgi:hypothetical protein
MIRIKSKRHNFRRCGIAHPSEAVEYPDDRFTPAELAILKAETMLIVEVVRKKEAPAAVPEKSAPPTVAEPGTDLKSVPKPGKKGKR